MRIGACTRSDELSVGDVTRLIEDSPWRYQVTGWGGSSAVRGDFEDKKIAYSNVYLGARDSLGTRDALRRIRKENWLMSPPFPSQDHD